MGAIGICDTGIAGAVGCVRGITGQEKFCTCSSIYKNVRFAPSTVLGIAPMHPKHDSSNQPDIIRLD